MIAFVSGWNPESAPIKAAVHQLITLGIPFSGWEEQQLSDEIPADLSAFDGMVIDGERLRKCSPEEEKILEQFAEKKFIHIIPESYKELSDFECDARSEVDFNIFAASADISAPGLPALKTETIVKGWLKIMEEYHERCIHAEHLHEYHLHCTVALLEAEKYGVLPSGWDEKINEVIRSMIPLVRIPADTDEIPAWAFSVMAKKRFGNTEFPDKAKKAADNILSYWCRADDGLLSMGGIREDPLFFARRNQVFFGQTRSTNSRRNLHLNEQLHYMGAAFPALSMATGDRKYMDEALKIMRHIDRVHRDPADGLLRHASLHGKPVGEKWGRGLTHALMGAFYMLYFSPELPADVRNEAVSFLDRTGDGLLKVQTENGLWRNVLDRKETAEETSCSVLITWIYAYGIRHGYFSKEKYLDMVLRAANALKSRFWRGYGSGNCRGTYPSPDSRFYIRRPLHMYMMPLIIPALLETDRLANSK